MYYLMNKNHAQSININDLIKTIMKVEIEIPFTYLEVNYFLDIMENEQKIIRNKDTVFII